MSESIRDERDRRIAELESLVVGLAQHITHLEDDLGECVEERAKAQFQHEDAVRKLERLRAERDAPPELC